jgi:hypothetical protein
VIENITYSDFHTIPEKRKEMFLGQLNQVTLERQPGAVC